ncbi:hypothetical protein [Blastococcus brunescens]|uniref:Uncharacterized protein n=1 Tax=Blastococcus brunescens TaxID=1564165 RepID=A0ABZ1B2I0_9ACTN|nr:hypothetical protein [Blastococcus sp. BMG 8361]WRL65017.1 hypothetical protein U6N30_04715 [Blastococcus sp. BMG 8361]
MRRLSALLSLIVAVGAVQLAASPALAGPAVELCTADDARGGVPADFVLDACADAGALTLRNDLGVPVVVRSAGDLAAPLTVHADDSAAAAVLRLAAGAATLLMPGDIVRWPLGAGAAELVVASLPGGAEDAIVREVGPALPKAADGSAGDLAVAFARVVDVVAPAVVERADCADGKNFLRVAACDVVISATIGRAVSMHLPRGAVRDVQALLDDPADWADWQRGVRTASDAVAGRTVRLAQAPVPSAPPPPQPAQEPPRSAPAPVPAPVPAPPASPPAPVAPPAPPPAPVAPAVPPVVDDVRSDAEEARARLEQWLREAFERARQELAERGNGNGNGNGRGNGRGG